MFSAAKDIIENSNKIGIFNHKNPDGDAMGTAYALKLALLSAGKQAEVFIRDTDKISKEYSYIKDIKTEPILPEECDLLIAVDSSDIGRLGEYGDIFKKAKHSLSIDHHISHIPFSEITLLDADAPACGQLLYELLDFIGTNVSADIAHNLYVAISADTGSFKYSSTTAKTHLIAAKLIECGIDVGGISKMLFDTKSVEYLNMMKFAIEKLELYSNSEIAVLCLEQSDFQDKGISENDASGIVSLPGTVKGVKISAYIRSRDDEIKVSLRSSSDIDAAKIAENFGGGGHIRAAGFSINGKSLSEAKETVIEALKKALR